MSTPLSLPQGGLRVGDQIITEGDNVTLGNNVGVKNNLNVGGSVYTNRVITPFVTREHTTLTPLIIDCTYTDHRILLRANPQGITFTNVPSATDGTFRVKVYLTQDAIGNRSVDWSLNNGTLPAYAPIIWTNTGTDPVAPVYPILQKVNGRVDIFEFITFDGGNNWVGSQINPTTPTYTDLASLLYATQSYNSNPAAPVNTQPYSGTIVQTKVVTSTAATDFSTINYVDLLTMTFYPKYASSRLLLIADIKHGVSPTSYSSHFFFTIGTNPISGANILSTLANGTNNTVNQSQNTHFGGYQQAVDSNHVEFKHGSISFSHNTNPGTSLDLRVRGRHADAWSDSSLILNRSWGFPDGAYSASNTSSFIVMEYIP